MDADLAKLRALLTHDEPYAVVITQDLGIAMLGVIEAAAKAADQPGANLFAVDDALAALAEKVK